MSPLTDERHQSLLLLLRHMTRLVFFIVLTTRDLQWTQMCLFPLGLCPPTGGHASRSVLPPLFRTASALEFPSRAALMRWPAVTGSEIFISIPSTFSRSSEECEKKVTAVTGVFLVIVFRGGRDVPQRRGKRSLKRTEASFIWGVNTQDQRFSTGRSQPEVRHRALLTGRRLAMILSAVE